MMDTYDPALAERVWRRVRSAAPPPAEDGELLPLMAEAWSAASACLQLARRLGSGPGETLRRIAREEQTAAACLRGLCLLQTGNRPELRTPPPAQEPVEAALRRRYTGCLRAAREYEKRTEDPQSGPVFAALARQEWDHCRRLLELLGSVPLQGK